jgi:hypothetical protein
MDLPWFSSGGLHWCAYEPSGWDALRHCQCEGLYDAWAVWLNKGRVDGGIDTMLTVFFLWHCLNQISQTQNNVQPPRHLTWLTKACAKKYNNPPPNTLETPICKSCPGEAHNPLECVKDIQRQCPQLPAVSGLPFRIGQLPRINNAPTQRGPCPQPAPQNLSNKQLCHWAFISAHQLQHRKDANLKFAG